MNDPQLQKKQFYAYFNNGRKPSRKEIFSAPEILDYYSYVVNTQQTDEAIGEAASELHKIDIYAAACLALVCGAWVEGGGNPEVGFDSLLLLFQRILQEIYPYAAQLPDGDDAEGLEAAKERWDKVEAMTAAQSDPEKEQVASYIAALDLLVLPMMAMLMRSETNRTKFREDALDLGGYFYYIYYADNLEFENLHFLHHVYGLSDIDSLFIVFPKQKTGMEVSVHAVNNNFHLFTLLQALIAEDGPELGLPQGASEAAERDFYTGAFHWLSAHAYEDGKLASPMALAWGEAPVYHNPQKNGQYIIYADEKTMGRSWDASFCTVWHDQQNAHVHFKRMLTLAEVEKSLA
ncbi:hypothetical protein ACTHGU_06590 [Chitinophagaceae bacterium MMS25-I14]